MTKWTYSCDCENFLGTFDTKEDAIDEAKNNIEDYIEDEDTHITLEIGKIQSAEYFLDKEREQIGWLICNYIEESLSDFIASDDPIVQLTKEESATLGKIVIDYIKERDGFKSWNVTDIEEYEYEI